MMVKVGVQVLMVSLLNNEKCCKMKTFIVYCHENDKEKIERLLDNPKFLLAVFGKYILPCIPNKL